MAADKRFTRAFKRHQWVCLALWIIGFFGGGGLFVLALGYDPMPGNEPFSLMYVLYQIIWSIASLSAVVFMLSLGAKYMNFNHKILAYGNEAVLPFYLFHQTIILIVGFFVIRLNYGIIPKSLIVTMISFSFILILYELLVKPFNVVRSFFGMRTKKKPSIKPGPTST
jgi:surface polysaccharide O-acyltransferase-like enzyme